MHEEVHLPYSLGGFNVCLELVPNTRGHLRRLRTWCPCLSMITRRMAFRTELIVGSVFDNADTYSVINKKIYLKRVFFFLLTRMPLSDTPHTNNGLLPPHNYTRLA